MKVLLPIDQSDSSKKAIRFVGGLFGGKTPRSDVSITLMHVIESLPEFLLRLGNDANGADLVRQLSDEWSRTGQEEGGRLLDEGRSLLEQAGIPAPSIQKTLIVKDGRPEARKVVAALAIIEEMKQGKYSVVCVGRRGTSAAEGIFVGSVAEKVLREAQGRTVWVVD